MHYKPLVTEDYFQDLTGKIFKKCEGNEHLVLDLKAEATEFVRFNGAKIRQTGEVSDAQVALKLVLQDDNGSLRQSTVAFALTGNADQDFDAMDTHLALLRKETASLPVDPFAVLPEDRGSSSHTGAGELLSREQSAAEILKPVQGLDFTGIYAAGPVIRANANSQGQQHWFQSESFLLDYSLYGAAERAYKGYYAGNQWQLDQFQKEIEQGKERLALLGQPVKDVPKGAYRTYLAPAAAWELADMLTGIFSEAAIRQAESPLLRVQQGKSKFSSLFSLYEDFLESDSPRFDSEGELAPECSTLLEAGELKQTLVNRRSAKEYNVKANGAGSEEYMRSLRIGTGDLSEEEVLAKLDNGLYLSNLHYLNWSDRPAGRITGMTRYACFWVEGGKIVAPIENLRWDDTIFRMLGDSLEAVGATEGRFSSADSYFFRSTGTTRVPGLLLSKMHFTL